MAETTSKRVQKTASVKPESLRGFADVTGELIKLDIGESVRGTLVGHNMVEGDNGEYPIFTFTDDEGTFKLAGTVQISQALANAEAGDEVFVSRLADGKSNKGRRFQSFDVKVRTSSDKL